MSDEKKVAEATPPDNHMPAPPTEEETVTTLDNHMPSEPTGIRTMDNHMPAPPALDLDGK
ncbi:sigma [Streptomyces toyocaensis]|uniref:Sigma n=1 Tax=Streptomyces toyocaensis TaxID=55952 RepID=A0A081XHC4_STRTO|nr:hypothetical protein [Streptomyces toyocaensis]KES02947.1 sigma [Streptomyces toyocaensis]